MRHFTRGLNLAPVDLLQKKINRPAVFADVCNEFKARYPMIKLIYAYLNPKPLERLEYMLIFKFIDQTNMIKMTIVCGNAFSLSSLEGYAISKERNSLDAWFKDVMDRPATYPEKFFKDIIEREEFLTYSKDPNLAEHYWKNPNNAERLIKHLDEYLVTFSMSNPHH